MSENIKVTFDTAEEDLHVNLDAGAIMYGKMQIGTTTTGESGTEAKVENVGSQTNAILNFTIPKGDKGEQGEKGEKGDTGSPVEVKDIPANTNVDEFFEEGTYAWNGDDGKAITGLPAAFSGVDIPQCEYILKVTKLSSRTTESGKLMETYEYNFSFAGILLYTQVRTVFTDLETGKKSYMNRSWKKIAMSDENGLVVSSTEPTIETEQSKVWLQKNKNLFNKNGTVVIDQYIDGGTGEIKPYVNGTKMFILEVQPNAAYTISKTQGGHFRVGTTNSYPSVGVIVDGMKNNGSATSITITTNSTAKYLCCSYWQTGVDTITEESMRESIQVERGLSATAYEEAITSAIYTKESNNKYEKFTETVAISSHQPTNQNGLWLQKGKNLFNKNDLKITNTWQVSYTLDDNKKLEITVTATGGVAFVRTNTFKLKAGTYTFSATTQGQLNEIRTYKNGGSQITTSTSNTFTFTLTEDTSIYFEFYVYNTSLTNLLSIENIQIERGTSATDYEEYIDKKIYVKNSNNVYEEFINADNVKNDYSLAETKIGTWIDGKPLYRIVVETTMPTVATAGTAVWKQVLTIPNADFGRIVTSTGKLNDTGYFSCLERVSVNSVSQYVRTYFDKIDGKDYATIQIVSSITSYNDKPVWIVAEYTKSTD